MLNKSSLLSGLLAVIVCVWVSGCKSSDSAEQGDRNWKPNTPSGLPEVIVKSAEFEPIQQAASTFFEGRGYSPGPSNHQYLMTFDRAQNTKKRRQALRVSIRAYPRPDGTWRLIGRPMGVDDWKTDLENEVFVSSGMSQIQDFLEQIQLMVELPQR